MKYLLLTVITASMLLVGVHTFAYTQPTTKYYKPDTGFAVCDEVTTKCDFNALLNLVNTVIDFLIFWISIPLAAIIFAWAGVLFITQGASADKRTKAKGMMLNVVIGLVLALAAWLIVKTILLALGYDGPLFLS